MSNLITNQFGQAKKAIPLPKRRGGNSTASLAAGDITKPELKKYLEAVKKGEAPDAQLEAKFNDYIGNGVSGGYLDDSEVRALYTDYVKKQIADGSADGLKKTVGSDSVFGDYIERKRFKHDSIESQLFEYIQVALEKKAQGKDPKSEPISLTGNERLEGFVDHLTDKDKGLIFKNTNLEQIRTSNDPILRLMHGVARDLGLDVAINSTRQQLLSGQSTQLTEKLGERLPDLLKKEEQVLNDILTPNGDLIISRRANGDSVKVPALEMTTDMKQVLAGGDTADVANSAFANEDKLDFRQFFMTAHKLSIQGDKNELDKHVADGLSFILAHHKAKLKVAENDNNKEMADEANKEFKLVSNAILGKSLLPTRLAKIVRESANTAIQSEDFKSRAAAGDIETLSKELLEKFQKELTTNRDITNLEGMTGILDNGQLTLINPDSFEKIQANIGYIESNEITDSSVAEANRDLSGNTLSLERVIDAYERTVEKASDKVFTTVATAVTGKANIVSKDTLDKLAHGTEEAISGANASISTSGEAFKVLAEQLAKYKNANATNDSIEDIKTSLKTFVEETLGTKGSDKKELWVSQRKEKDGNGVIQTIKEDTKLEQKVSEIADKIKAAKGNSSEDALKTDFIGLLTDNNGLEGLLKEQIKSKDSSATLNSLVTDKKGIERLKTLTTNLRVKLEDSESLSKTLDLDKMMQIFEGTEGKKLQRALEELAYQGSKFSDIKDQPDSIRFGEFTTLLFAKDSKGGIDESKRLTALVQLINKAGSGSDMSSLTTHIVSKLKGSGVKKNDETGIAVRLKNALNTTIDVKTKTDKTLETATQGLNESQGKVNELETLLKQAEAEEAAKGSNAGLSSAEINKQLELAKAKLKVAEANFDEAQKASLKNGSTKSVSLTDFIKTNVINAQQRKIVLEGAYNNMVRQLDQIKGHFTAVGIKYFGDAEAYNKTTKPAADTLISTLDAADKDAPDAIDKVKQALANDTHALNMFNQLHNGIKINPLKAPEYKTEHPGDIIERILSFIQSTIYSPVLSLFGAGAGSTESKETTNV